MMAFLWIDLLYIYTAGSFFEESSKVQSFKGLKVQEFDPASI